MTESGSVQLNFGRLLGNSDLEDSVGATSDT